MLLQESRMLGIVFFLFLAFSLASCSKKAQSPLPEQGAQSTDSRPVVLVSLGDRLFHSSKFRCYQCHGIKGSGGEGPSLVGISKKMSPEKLAERAHHMCPPSRVCNPGDFRAIISYLKTLQ